MTGLAQQPDLQPSTAFSNPPKIDLDWNTIAADLNAAGQVTIGPVLSDEECGSLIEAYDSRHCFAAVSSWGVMDLGAASINISTTLCLS